MLTPPDSLEETHLVDALADRWSLRVRTIEYLPVGFGSHHWAVVDERGDRRFVTVDDLDSKLESQGDIRPAALLRLRRALRTARGLADAGLSFVVAPLPTSTGDVVIELLDRFGMAVYPYVEGETFVWGQDLPDAVVHQLVDHVAALHSVDLAGFAGATLDDFTVPKRGGADALLAGERIPADQGPYAKSTTVLVAENAGPIGALFDRYELMVEELRLERPPVVITHGEPHPGNVIETPAGPALIDWDTTKLAPPERDLWLLRHGDRSVVATYSATTGYVPSERVLELYRTWWALADLAAFVDLFRRPHHGTDDDQASWRWLSALVEDIGSGRPWPR